MIDGAIIIKTPLSEGLDWWNTLILITTNCYIFS